MFSEKLSYIMMITNTTNSELAEAINVTQSLISKYKKGVRIPPLNSNHINNICDFFIKKINNSKESILILSKLSIKNNTKSELQNYFIGNKSIEASFKEDIANAVILYYGEEGKQNAIQVFLETVLKNDKNTLYIYSDENMSWMTNLNNSSQWIQIIQGLIKSHIKIKIIHSLNRNYIELFEAVTFWLPLYLACNVEPYYIPKLRDGINRRSLFISNHDAVISNSVNENVSNMLNIYIQDKNAIKCLKTEYNNYLSLATPLFKKITFNENKYSEYKKYNKKFKDNIKTSIYVLDDKELIVAIPNTNYALKSNETTIIRAFLEYLIKK